MLTKVCVSDLSTWKCVSLFGNTRAWAESLIALRNSDGDVAIASRTCSDLEDLTNGMLWLLESGIKAATVLTHWDCASSSSGSDTGVNETASRTDARISSVNTTMKQARSLVRFNFTTFQNSTTITSKVGSDYKTTQISAKASCLGLVTPSSHQLFG